MRLFKSREHMDDARCRVERETPRRNPTTTTGVDLPASDACQRVFGYALEEAKRLKHSHVAPEHLLLGIVRESTNIVARVVLESGITLSQLEQEVRQGKEMAAAASASSAAKSDRAPTPSVVMPTPKPLGDLVPKPDPAMSNP
jgi:ATP-dependent Clp protease ATP-binding subunit ClpA